MKSYSTTTTFTAGSLYCLTRILSVENVVGIIDMGDCQINKKFFCKDLGALKIGEISASSYFFRYWHSLAVPSPKKIKSHVRGRDVCTNFHSGCFQINELDVIVKNVYDSVKLETFSTVA